MARPDELKNVSFGTLVAMFRCFKGHLGELMPAPRATATFDAGEGGAFPGGAQVAVTTTKVGSELAVPAEEPVREGHAFAGWWTAASGGSPAGGEVASEAPMAFFAHWEPLFYTVTFDPAYDGAPEPTTASVAYGSLSWSAPAQRRPGWKLVGWRLGDVAYAGADGAPLRAWDVAGDATLAAAWERNVAQPAYDEATGRYDNGSIAEWLDSMADGLVYGVRVPKFAHDPGTDAVKTGANAGLVLEPSTAEVAGRNDYLGRKLFACTRCNGGVDADGMPYVTAIEGMDSRFSATEADTWAITPVYWMRWADGEEFADWDYCDSPREGFSACPGAKVPDGRWRPYILRACYASGAEMGSRSGQYPGTAVAEGQGGHVADSSWAARLAESQAREDGLSYLTSCDVDWRNQMMCLMLGTKSLKAVSEGAGGAFNSNITGALTDDKMFPRTYYDWASTLVDRPLSSYVGRLMSVGSSRYTSESPYCYTDIPLSRIERAWLDEAGHIVLELDREGPFTFNFNSRIRIVHYATGCTDAVLGTCGCAFRPATGYSVHSPFRFQNCEWGLGLSEVAVNLRCDQGGFWFASDVASCSAQGTAVGWERVAADLAMGELYTKGISDWTCERGMMVPLFSGSNGYGTGCGACLGWIEMDTKEAGGVSYDGNPPNPVSGTGWMVLAEEGASSWRLTSRLSAIGRSAPWKEGE